MHEGAVVVQVQPGTAAQVEELGFKLQVPMVVPVHPAGVVSDQVHPGCAAHVVEL